jgi:hypothetical protein
MNMVTRFYYLIALFVGFAAPISSASASSLNESLIYHSYFSTAAEVKSLLDKGADPNSKDKHGWTALAIASDRADPQATPIAEALIAKGADINAAVDRNSPIINAISNKNASLVRVLLLYKVNLKVADSKGNSPMALAKKMQQADIIYYLDKKAFEEAQLSAYLFSTEHYQQITSKFIMANCQYQYWSFYLKSEQDENMDKVAITERIQQNAKVISAMNAEGSRYFALYRDGKMNQVAADARNVIFQQLNAYLSNRNRRENGVGKESDMLERCGKLIAAMQQK